MKQYFIIFLFLISSLNLTGQFDFYNKLVIQTIDDEAGGLLTAFNNDHFLLTTSRGRIVAFPNNNNAFYDYTNITYKISKELELVDSMYFHAVEGYGTRVAKIIPLPNGNFFAVGNAFDSVSNDFQLYMRWFNAELQIIRDSLVGSQSLSEHWYATLLNQAGNIVISGGYGNADTAVFGHHYFYEMSQEGNLLQHYTDTSSIYRFGLVQSSTEGKYFQSGWPNKLLRLNNDFSLDTIIAFDGQLELEIRDFGKLNDSTVYYAGNYLVQTRTPDIDMAIQPVGLNGALYPLIHFGAMDTLDFYQSTRVNDEGIFLIGVKNSVSGPVPSWYMAVKLNHNLYPEYQIVYGDGVKKFYMGDAMAIADGGCIVSTGVWDFANYPENKIQHDVIVVRYDANGQLVGKRKLQVQQMLAVKLAPNPATALARIMDEQHCYSFAQVYDQQGRFIVQLPVRDCNYIQTVELKPAIYLLRMIDTYGRQAFARLIKQ